MSCSPGTLRPRRPSGDHPERVLEELRVSGLLESLQPADVEAPPAAGITWILACCQVGVELSRDGSFLWCSNSSQHVDCTCQFSKGPPYHSRTAAFRGSCWDSRPEGFHTHGVDARCTAYRASLRTERHCGHGHETNPPKASALVLTRPTLVGEEWT